MNEIKKILVIGGAGYVGTNLVTELLKNNYHVTVYDLMIYGNKLPEGKSSLKTIKGDVRDQRKLEQSLKDQDAIIHLACISNDPSFELNPKLGQEINFDCFEPLVKASKNNGVKQFIYASSSSVYGVKDTPDVTEDASLEPLTDYSKFKAKCEDILISNTNSNFIGTIIRPATVCGFSKRLRLDVVLNLFCYQAFFKKKITVLGGKQIRPILHIKDMVDVYDFILKKNITGIYNVGFENLSVKKIAQEICRTNKTIIEFKKSNDPRSYRMNSDKIIKKGFKPKYNFKDCIKDLLTEFKKGYKPTEKNWNLKWLLKKNYIKKNG